MKNERAYGPNKPTMNQIWAQEQLLGCTTCVAAQGPHDEYSMLGYAPLLPLLHFK